MLNRFSVMLSSPETSIPIMVNDPAGPWVHESDYAELKEKCERYMEICDELDSRCNGLKNERVHDLNQVGGLQEEVARLQAEVNRLRKASFVTAVPAKQYELVIKAGDAMASSIKFNEEMAQDYNGPTIIHQCVKVWEAAKDGKQS